MMRGRFWVVLCVLLAGGCAGMHIENTPLQAGDGNPDLRTIDPASPDRPVVLMTFSGGGSRAAALAESVLRELAQTSYAASDGPHVLTEDVKLISSVSGGSVTAAWFGLRRGTGHWDGDLDGLRNDFLSKDNMATLELDAINPITWLGLVTGQITRIEAEEALFNQRLYHDAPLAALNQPGKPYIVLNANRYGGRRDVCDGAAAVRRCLLEIRFVADSHRGLGFRRVSDFADPRRLSGLFQWLPGQIAQRRMDSD